MRALEFNAKDLLLRAVDDLSLSRTVTIWQEAEKGKVPVPVIAEPLLKMLRESITSNIGAGPGGSALASQRNVINLEALQLYDELEAAILIAYGRVTSAVPYMLPEQNLRQWFIAFNTVAVSEDALLEEANAWSGWARRIEDLLFPQTQLEVTTPCPECGKRWVKSGDGGAVTALVVEYRKPSSDQVNVLAKSVARCRGCKKVWRGSTRIRELRFAIDQLDDVEIPEPDFSEVFEHDEITDGA
jgi:hypothetical protein